VLASICVLLSIDTHDGVEWLDADLDRRKFSPLKEGRGVAGSCRGTAWAGEKE